MLTRQSLEGIKNITSEIIEIKAITPKVSNIDYSNRIKPLIDNYTSINIKTPNLLFKEELMNIDFEHIFKVQGFSFYGQTVNSHVWASLYIPGGDVYTNPQFYITANGSGIKYGIDYGSSIQNDNIYVNKVRKNELIQNEILRILNINIGLKFYNLEKGSPLLPEIGSELLVNSTTDIVNKWNNKSHIIGQISYTNIDNISGQLIHDNLGQLYKLYKMICFDDEVASGENQTEKVEEGKFSDIVEISTIQDVDENYDSKNNAFIIDLTKKGSLQFPFKNIILKGVPGTGKSRLLDVISDKCGIKGSPDSQLRINVHSASTNSDLMRGIGISTNSNHDIEYHEKRGLILNHINKALKSPLQPFVIILEEIQENSLNQLIGDLIYLIEEEKRADIPKIINQYGLSSTYQNEDAFLEIITSYSEINYVTVPYLVLEKTQYRKMILPNNLYLFCTSNYRDDRKIIEDNLLRRFEVIELYPRHDKIEDISVKDFLKELNESIYNKLKEIEMHPDRFKIGHAIWMNVKDKISFFRSLLKVVIEFQDIKELDFQEFNEIINNVNSWPYGITKDQLIGNKGYSAIVEFLQDQVYNSFIND